MAAGFSFGLAGLVRGEIGTVSRHHSPLSPHPEVPRQPGVNEVGGFIVGDPEGAALDQTHDQRREWLGRHAERTPREPGSQGGT